MRIKKATALAMSTMITLTTIMPGVSYATETIKEDNIDNKNIQEQESTDISKIYNVNFNIKNSSAKFVDSKLVVSTPIKNGEKIKIPRYTLEKGYNFIGWTDQEGTLYTTTADIENLSVDKDYTFTLLATKVTGELLTEFKDANLREIIIKAIGSNRAKTPEEVELPEGYTNPIYSTDLAEIKKIERIHVSPYNRPVEKTVKSLDGIDKLENLKELLVYGADIPNMNLKDVYNLEKLTVEYSNVENMTLPNSYYSEGLKEITLADNKIKSLDFTGHKYLAKVDLDEKELEEVNTKDLIRAKEIRIRNSKKLSEIDTNSFRGLTELNLQNSGFKDFDASNMIALKKLNLDNNNLTNINISKTSPITHLDISNNKFTELNLDSDNLLEIAAANNPTSKVNLKGGKLYHVDLRNANLSDIDVSGLGKLMYLFLDNDNKSNTGQVNRINNIDLSQNKELIKFYANNNFIKNLDLSQNSKLVELKVRNNGLRDLKLSDDCQISSALSGNFDISNNELVKFVYKNGDKIELNYIEEQSRKVTPKKQGGKTFVDMKELLGDDYNLLERTGAKGGYISEDGKFNFASGDVISYQIHSANINGPLMTVKLYLTDAVEDDGIYFEPVEDIYVLKDSDAKNIKPVETVKYTNADGTIEEKDVKWDIKDIDTSELGNFIINGKIKGSKLSPKFNIKVVELQEFKKLNIGKAGIETLPKEATVKTINGEEKLPINWETSVDFAKEGVQLIEGNIKNLGKVKIEVEVVDGEDYVLDIPSEALREKLVKSLGYFRDKAPEGLNVPNTYKNPLYSSDIAKLKDIQYLTIDGQKFVENGRLETPVDSLKGIEYLTGLKSLNIDIKDFSYEGTQPTLKSIDLTNNSKLERINILGIGIKELKLGDTSNIQNIDLDGNNLTSFEINDAEKLVNLVVSNNKLENLKVGKAPSLDIVRANNNNLSKVDFEDAKNIRLLYMNNNSLEGKLDITHIENLYDLNVSNNNLTEINAKGLKELVAITANNNNIDKIEIDANNSTLYSITANNNNFKELNFASKTINRVELNDNNVEKVNTKNLPMLQNLYLSNLNGGSNKLEKIDVLSNKELERLSLENVGLTEINVKGLNKLRELYLNNNKIKTINVKTSEKLHTLKLDNNQLENIVLPDVKDSFVNILHVRNNKLKDINFLTSKRISDIKCGFNQLTEIKFIDDNLAARYNPVFSPQVINIEPEIDEDGNKYIDLAEFGVNELNNIKNIRGGKLVGSKLIIDKDAVDISYAYHTNAKGNLNPNKLPDTTMLVYFDTNGNGMDDTEIETPGTGETEKPETGETEKPETGETEKPEVKTEIERISGSNRYETSTEISKKLYKNADTVVIAEGGKYVDALTSSPYAQAIDAPILYVKEGQVPENIKSEIERLKAKKAIVIGGENTIKNTVIEDLKASGLKVERFAGDNRYETSALVANELTKLSGSKDIFVTDGIGADALSVSSIAGKNKTPILLVDKVLGEKSKEVLKNSDNAVIIGGLSSVNKDMEKEVKDIVKVDSRISGKDRFETSKTIIEKYYKDTNSLVLASGKSLSDALVGGQVAVSMDTGLLLVDDKSEDTKIEGKDKVIILGGEDSISDNIVK